MGDSLPNPPTPSRIHPIEVVPPPTLASPSDLHPVYDPAVPFWKPPSETIIKKVGWRWIFLLPAVLVFAALVAFPLQFRFLQLLIVGGWKFMVITIGLAAGAVGAAVRSTVQQRKEPFCIHCGYDLNGLPDHYTCPECGRGYSFILIEEYRRDPDWFIKRYKAGSMLPIPATAFDSGPVRRKKSRDGT